MNGQTISLVVTLLIYFLIFRLLKNKITVSKYDVFLIPILGFGLLALGYSDWPWLIYIALPLVLLGFYIFRKHQNPKL